MARTVPRRPAEPRDWRWFLAEFTVVAAGVLAGLTADAAVAALRDRSDAREARQAVRAEIAADLGYMVRHRRDQGCTDKRLKELTDIVASAREQRPHSVAHWVGRVVSEPISSRRWTAASQAGRVTRFPNDEQAQYAGLYFIIDGFADVEERQQRTWATLRTLENVQTMSPAMIWGLTQALGDARLDNYRLNRQTDRALAAAAALGIRPKEPMKTALDLKTSPVCVPIETDRASALRMIGNATSEP